MSMTRCPRHGGGPSSSSSSPSPRRLPVTVMEIVVSVAVTLSLVVVVAIIIKAVVMAMRPLHQDHETRCDVDVTSVSKEKDIVGQGQHRLKGDATPCCLPFKFQAVLIMPETFDVKEMKVTRVYRDWDSRLQAMEQTTFDLAGNLRESYSKTILDYKQNTAYRILLSSKQCFSYPINSGMLEPCMPEDSQYLGQSHIGFYDDKRTFHSFYFRRTDKNRNMSMTIAVTSDRCVPVMEKIQGTIGGADMDNMFFFSNVTSLHDDSVFSPPEYCFHQAH